MLVVDDCADRAAALVTALDDPQHRYEITPEATDIEAVLGPDSPWDCVICHVELLNVSWASVRRAPPRGGSDGPLSTRTRTQAARRRVEARSVQRGAPPSPPSPTPPWA